MRYIFVMIISLSFCSSCQQNRTQKYSQLPKILSGNNDSSASTNLIDSSIVQIDSTFINGQKITAFSTSNYGIFILNAKLDTIFSATEMFSDFRFEDFNKDGFEDIRVFYMGNVPGFQNLILYDRITSTFKIVEDFDNFPAPENIQGTKYYYSYERAGCADSNWESSLFYIQNFKTIRIATIHGRGCNDLRDKNGVYIYHVRGEVKKLTDKFPIEVINKYKEYKWGFLKSYWSKQYRSFL